MKDTRLLLQTAGTPFTVERYEPRAVVFFQGDACDEVMIIEQGRVSLAVTKPGGREAICGILSTGAFLGDDALAGYPAWRQTATAITRTTVLAVEKAHMLRLLHTDQAFADRFIAHVLQRHNRLEADLTDQILNAAEQRLARTLVLLADCHTLRSCRCVLPHISQEMIAEMVGTTRSRVNILMNKFKKLGFIEEAAGELRVTPSIFNVVHNDHPVSHMEHRAHA